MSSRFVFSPARLDELTESDIVIVPEEDAELYALEFEGTDRNCKALYSISDELACRLPFVNCYIADKEAIKVATPCENFLRYELASWSEYLNYIKKNAPIMCENKNLICNWLECYVNNVLEPVLNSAIFRGVRSEDWEDDWLSITWKISADFSCYFSLLKEMPQRVVQVIYQSEEHNYARKMAQIWGGSVKSSPSEKCLLLACYCFFLSRVKKGQQQFDLALIYAHRAVDFFLQHIGLESGELCNTRYGVRFKHDINQMIGVHRLFTYLDRKKKLTTSRSSADKEKTKRTIKKLNNKRNKLILTHGVYVEDSLELSLLLGEIEAFFSKNYVHWNRFSKQFDLPENVSALSTLVKAETSLDVFIQRVC